MRLPSLLFAVMLITGPALAEEPAVVVLRGSSAPPTVWSQPPPPQIETVYVPVYYLPLYGPVARRHHHAHPAKRNR